LIVYGVLMIALGVLVNPPGGEGAEVVELPSPSLKGPVSVAEALKSHNYQLIPDYIKR